MCSRIDCSRVRARTWRLLAACFDRPSTAAASALESSSKWRRAMISRSISSRPARASCNWTCRSARTAAWLAVVNRPSNRAASETLLACGNALAHGETNETTFGRPADPAAAKRTVRVEMTDQMRFQPAEITVKRNETVRFVPVNSGQVMHEMVLGTMAELKRHAEMMKKGAHMSHEEFNMAHVAPGKQGEIGWQFTKAGEFFYACLIPGHFDAGMIGRVKVVSE